MNYSVHALMYFYYFLSACGHRLRWLAPVVTLMQTSQMAVGILVQVSTWIYINTKRSPCNVTYGNWLAGLLMCKHSLAFGALL